MKTKKRKLAQYMKGTGNTGVRNYMPDPSEVLAQDDINKAKAQYEGATNPFVIGLNTTAALMETFKGPLAGEMAKLGDPFGGEFNEVPGATVERAALGSAFTGSEMVELEGKEMVETPDGSVAKVEGPSHEDGGVPAELPLGTKVYSDRIKVGGKTMAERKKARENRMNTLQKKLDKNPTDKILKNTLNRTIETHQMEEEADLMVQEFANAMEQMLNVAESSMKKMANGGYIYPSNVNRSMYEDLLKGYMDENPEFDINSIDDRKSLQKTLGVSQDGIFGPKTFDALKEQYPLRGVSSITREPAIPSTATPPLVGENMTLGRAGIPSSPDGNILEGTGESDGPGALGSILQKATTGDLVGMFGTAVSGFGPYLNTLKNRAGDTPNINAFKDFGKDALEANAQAKQYVDQVKDENIGDVKLARQTSQRRNRNTARGVNQMRALDITSDIAANEAIQNIHSTFAQQMMQLFREQAGLENVQDQAVMTGEQRRDLADRQDRDNFNTQLGQDIATMGTAIQKFAKDLNTSKGNQDFLDVLPDLSAYGIGYVYNDKGELVLQKIDD